MKKTRYGYDEKAGDVFDGPAGKDYREDVEVDGIVRDQLEQHAGNPDEYPYSGTQGRYHYYWTIVDGGWNVAKRRADAGHPANGPWDPWKNPPEGVEPPGGGGLDPFNW